MGQSPPAWTPLRRLEPEWQRRCAAGMPGRSGRRRRRAEPSAPGDTGHVRGAMLRPDSPTLARSSVAPSAALILRVGLDDLAHEPVPDDVGFVQVIERDALDAGEHPLNLDQT